MIYHISEVRLIKVVGKYLIIAYLMLFSCEGVSSQNIMQTANWVFGERTWLAFKEDGSFTLNGIKHNSVEGTATISDESGRLLFYTNGIELYDSNQTLLADDLNSDLTCTQSSIFLKINSKKGYYLITNNVGGLYYSFIDYSAKFPAGFISKKNKAIFMDELSEKLTACRIPDTDAYWIVGSIKRSALQFVVRLDESGFSEPEYFCVGEPVRGYIGEMRFSPDGRFVAKTTELDGLVELFCFDPIKGRFLSSVVISRMTAYGLCFSALSDKLFVVKDVGQSAQNIYVYDLKAGLDKVSSTARALPLNDMKERLQIGPDYNIYSIGYYHVAKLTNTEGPIENIGFENLLDTGLCCLGITNFASNYFHDKVHYTPFPFICGSSVCFYDKWLQELYIPNIISPNGDGLNDAFHIRRIDEYDEIDISIYNRWGECVFKSTDISFSWDGSYNGKPVVNGSYFYVANYTTFKHTYHLRGVIFVLR
ncbi:T9SS type B sorting domain-containing protein [bacterium]|nr:T9SS type B sorting domain-containing protein [bacterium]